MPIPPQNDFLLPFLNLLSDGQSLTRGHMTDQLAQHFGISEEEAQQMSGNQFTLVSRVAWCDVHFCKAGFVEKRRHHSDSTQDEFRITVLGVNELNRRPETLTVGYLQTFYRGKVHRGAGSDDTTSEAELALYEAFEGLPDSFTVLHGVKWFARHQGTVGEVDFLIAHPDYGVLVLEVKGGQISIENGQWYSTGFHGNTHSIQDPCKQANRNRRALHDWLEDDPRTRNIKFALFPAVAVPDSRVTENIRPDCPRDIFIDTTHLENLEGRLIEIFEYWSPRADAKNSAMSGQAAVDALVDLLVPTRKLQPRIAEVFERERRKIEELTESQFGLLNFLRGHKHAAIVGGAGTGKTLLAMEKAMQLAEAGHRVLFLGFNRNLVDWISQNLSHEAIMVCTFHSLVGHARNWARLWDASRLGWDEFREQAPDLLLDAADMIRAPGSDTRDKLFDAVLVDEAQDFEDTWWVGILEMMHNVENGVLYVFFDDNQRIYTQISNIPVETPPFHLEENCRNTQHIHAALQPFVPDSRIKCLGPEGRPVEVISASDKKAERRELQRVLHRLVNEEDVAPEDIIILTPSSERRSQWKKDDQLGNFIITWQLDTEMSLAARVSTIYSYKGLESAVVILTELQHLREEIRDQLLYVGLSRARHHAVIIGELPTPSGSV